MPNYLMKLTSVGAAKVATAIAGGPPLRLTHMAAGDGNGNAVGLPNGTELALIREVYRDQISSLSVDGTLSKIFIAEMVIPSSVGGWTVRELGIYDIDGDLVAYGNFPATYKPIIGEGSYREMVIRAMGRVENTDVVQLVINDSVVLASRAWVHSQISPAAIFGGGLTGQVLAKRTNADGDWVWIDLSTGLEVVVSCISEVQTLAADQEIVNFSTLTTQGIAVYIAGIRLIEGEEFSVDSDTHITLSSHYPEGTKLHAYQNDPLSSLRYLNPLLNLGDVSNKKTARKNLNVVSKAKSYFMGQL